MSSIRHGTAKMLNGASPGVAPTPALARAAGAPSDGGWVLTPNAVSVPLEALMFEQGSTFYMEPLTDCTLAFDITQPGLAQSLACTFDLPPAGTYPTVSLQLGSSYQITIDDPVNNIYTDPSSPTLLSTTAPAGGAQPVTIPIDSSLGGEAGVTPPTPLVISDGGDDGGGGGDAAGTSVTVSLLLDGLQSFAGLASDGTMAFGPTGDGNPGQLTLAMAVGAPTAIAAYINTMIDTPYSFNTSVLGTMQINGPYSATVLYSEGNQPESLSIGVNGPASGCEPFDDLYLFPGENAGEIGVADNTIGGVAYGSNYSPATTNTPTVEYAMEQVSTLGSATTFNCIDISSDPMPPGGSFTTAPPMIASPTFTESMTLVAD